jgi:hypothetical protein
MRIKFKVFPLVDKLDFIFVDQPFELIVLEPIHYQFLVYPEAFVI